jgi:ABC-2 type transport system permease protein
MSEFRPNYMNVWWTFFRNSLVREMTFRSHFIITSVTRLFWFSTQLVLFELIFRTVPQISDWSRYEYFAFMATSMLINALIETFFMPNCANFSELIRSGRLDFVLVKPIDTQFMVSFEKLGIANLSQAFLAICLLIYSLSQLHYAITLIGVIQYIMLVMTGVVFFYSLMMVMASTSVWMGRNQGLYDFWFYVTVFARYPMDVYSGSPSGELIRFGFTYIIPILLVVTVPARSLLDKTLEPSWLTIAAPVLTLASLFIARGIFFWSLRRYQSASS